MAEGKYTSKRITCRHCNNTSYFLDLGKVQRDIEEAEISFSWNILICEHCQEETIERQYTNFGSAYPDPTEEDENNYYIESDLEIIYPPDGSEKISYEPSIDMQKLVEIAPSVARAYEIAINILSTEPIASAVFVRKTLECLCQQKGITDADTHKLGGPNRKLKLLLDKGIIHQKLYDLADGLKDLGDASAHQCHINDISLDDAVTLLRVCGDLLADAYQLDLEHVKDINKKLGVTKKGKGGR